MPVEFPTLVGVVKLILYGELRFRVGVAGAVRILAANRGKDPPGEYSIRFLSRAIELRTSL